MRKRLFPLLLALCLAAASIGLPAYASEGDANTPVTDETTGMIEPVEEKSDTVIDLTEETSALTEEETTEGVSSGVIDLTETAQDISEDVPQDSGDAQGTIAVSLTGYDASLILADRDRIWEITADGLGRIFVTEPDGPVHEMLESVYGTLLLTNGEGGSTTGDTYGVGLNEVILDGLSGDTLSYDVISGTHGRVTQCTVDGRTVPLSGTLTYTNTVQQMVVCSAFTEPTTAFARSGYAYPEEETAENRILNEVSGTITVTGSTKYEYSLAEYTDSSWATHTFNVSYSGGSSVAFCINPTLWDPLVNDTYSASEYSQQTLAKVKKALYYGARGYNHGGIKKVDDMILQYHPTWNATKRDIASIIITHAVVSKITGDTGWAYGANQRMRDDVARYEALLDTLPDPPATVRLYKINQRPKTNTPTDITQGMVFLEGNDTGKRWITLRKQSSSTIQTNNNPNYTLAGAQYGLYRDAACTQLATFDSGAAATFSTDANGATGNALLPRGVYYLKEISPSPGYAVNPTVTTIDFSPGPGSAGSSTTPYTVTVNEPPVNYSPPFSIIKTSSDGSVADLFGAQFTVKFYALSTSDNLTLAQLAAQTPTKAGVVQTVAKTSGGTTSYVADFNDTSCWISGYTDMWKAGSNVYFPLGYLTIEETAAPAGYQTANAAFSVNGVPLGTEKVLITIAYNASNPGTPTVTVNGTPVSDTAFTVADDPVPPNTHSLTVTKAVVGRTDTTSFPVAVTLTAPSGSDLSGVTFTDAQNAAPISWTTASGTAKTVYFSSSARVTIYDIPDGTTYRIVESTPTGYTVSGNVTTATALTADATKTITNTWRSYPLTITKTVAGKTDNNTRFPVAVTLTADTPGTDLSGVLFTDADHTTAAAWDVASGTAKTLYVKGGESIVIANIPRGTKYKVIETAPEGYTVSGNITANATLNGSRTVSLKNTWKRVDLVIDKNVTGRTDTSDFPVAVTLTAPAGCDLSGVTYTDAVDVDGDWSTASGTAQTLYFSSSIAIEIYDIPYGTTYTIVETPPTGYSVSGNVTAAETLTAHAAKTITNTWPVYPLTVTKTVIGKTDTSNFPVAITLTAPAGCDLSGVMYKDAATPTATAWNTASGTAKTLQVKAGTNISITGVPRGTTYTIIEDAQAGYTTTGNVTTAATLNAAQTVALRNTLETKNLMINKSVIGGSNTAVFPVAITFTVPAGADISDIYYFDAADQNGEYWDVASGAAKTLYFSGSTGIEIYDVPYGTTYTIIETPPAGYTVSGNVTAAETLTANATKTITNARLCQLAVSKTVTGNFGSRDKEFHYTLQLSGTHVSHNAITYTKYGGTGGTSVLETGTVNPASLFTFTLTHGQSMTFSGIVDTSAFVVTEVDANSDAYTTTAACVNATAATDAATGAVVVSGTFANADAAAAFTNHRHMAVPTKTGPVISRMIPVLAVVLGIGTAAVVFNKGKKRGDDE